MAARVAAARAVQLARFGAGTSTPINAAMGPGRAAPALPPGFGRQGPARRRLRKARPVRPRPRPHSQSSPHHRRLGRQRLHPDQPPGRGDPVPQPRPPGHRLRPRRKTLTNVNKEVALIQLAMGGPGVPEPLRTLPGARPPCVPGGQLSRSAGQDGATALPQIPSQHPMQNARICKCLGGGIYELRGQHRGQKLRVFSTTTTARSAPTPSRRPRPQNELRAARELREQYPRVKFRKELQILTRGSMTSEKYPRFWQGMVERSETSIHYWMHGPTWFHRGPEPPDEGAGRSRAPSWPGGWAPRGPTSPSC